MDTLSKFPIQKAYKTKLATVPLAYRSRGRAGLCLSALRERVGWGLYRFPRTRLPSIIRTRIELD